MKSYIKCCLFFLSVLACIGLYAQKKQITLEDIWTKGTFKMESFEGFQWMKTSGQYSRLTAHESGTFGIDVFEVESGKKIKTLVPYSGLIPKGDSVGIAAEEYELSNDETKVLIKTETEHIYRRSSKAIYYVYDIATKTLTVLSKGEKTGYASFSPDGKKVAYTKANNLYMTDLTTGVESQITHTGKWNEIIHGSTDWVYEEEFEITRAFFWSPDSRKIAFLTFDESQVKEYNMQLWGKLYPVDYKFKYPKAGEKNAETTVSLYDIEKKTVQTVLDGKGRDIYIPRINWTFNPDILSIRWMNRFQDTLKIIHADFSKNTQLTVKAIASKDYVEINDNFFYSPSANGLICTDESDGYRHIYRFDMNGKLLKQITKGQWEVNDIVGLDEKNKLIYYTSKEASVLENHLYVIDFEGNNQKRLTTEPGTHDVALNPSCTYFVDYNSNISTGNTVGLHAIKDGKRLKMLENNEAFRKKLSEYETGKLEFLRFKNRDKVSLDAWMLKPANFDSTKKYPVFTFVYGGPHSQEVANKMGRYYFWFQMLAQKGYIVACVDNRGTDGKGTEFKNATTRQLGKLETHDQIDFAKYLGAKSYVDNTRIGIFGWSYGGYMSSLCILLGADIYKMAIAVAPVSSWRFYDSIYTERYLKTPQNNPGGYDEFSPVKHADKLKGKYLLIHGTGDDNVHFQNAIEMQDALIKAKKQFSSFYYPNKNHGISGGATRLHLFKMMTDFIEENL